MSPKRFFVSLLAASAMLAPAHAAAPSDFYRGRTIFVLVGFTPGGGYDLYARLLAQHLGKHIPGNPTVVTQNMPGAGSLKAVNYLYSVAPKDGTYIATFGREQVVAPLFGQANFDAAKLTWLGSVTKETSVCVSWYQSPIKSWNDAMSRQFTVGGSAAGADPDNFSNLYRHVFGAKIKLATGFPGTSDITLAMQRREVDGLCGFSWSTLKSHYGSWLHDKKVNVLIQAGTKRSPDLSDVPAASEFAKTPEQHQILDFVLATQITARPFAAPPGIPADRKAILRSAFDETMKDPAILAGAEKLQLEVDPVSGAEVDAVVHGLYATPKEMVAKAARALAN
jgi:tripartite-type tricarboxylate transporter receptor subunit TctC